MVSTVQPSPETETVRRVMAEHIALGPLSSWLVDDIGPAHKPLVATRRSTCWTPGPECCMSTICQFLTDTPQLCKLLKIPAGFNPGSSITSAQRTPPATEGPARSVPSSGEPFSPPSKTDRSSLSGSGCHHRRRPGRSARSNEVPAWCGEWYGGAQQSQGGQKVGEDTRISVKRLQLLKTAACPPSPPRILMHPYFPSPKQHVPCNNILIPPVASGAV